ncbi:hypothetical protein Ct61P_08066 [Colletotrichum tofieldiae]|nr:hypothetical protein Ct61P_08066 [Colletotrichum tofieldiae]
MIFSDAEAAQYTGLPHRIFGLAAVDLHSLVEAVRELEHYVKEEGFALFLKCIELDVLFLTQVGHTAPACKGEVGRSIQYIDTLKFPTLKIIMGHIGYPWAVETVAAA